MMRVRGPSSPSRESVEHSVHHTERLTTADCQDSCTARLAGNETCFYIHHAHGQVCMHVCMSAA